MDKKLNDQTVEEIVEEETETEETTVTEKEERPRRTRQDGATRSPRGGRRPTRGRRTAPKAKEYEERVVYINRVSKTTKGGRRLRFSAVTVVGDGKGKYGFASAKAAEVPDAIKKSLDKAKKDRTGGKKLGKSPVKSGTKSSINSSPKSRDRNIKNKGKR